MPNYRFTKELKLEIIHACESASIKQVATAYNVNPSTIKKWNQRYRLLGEGALENKIIWKTYTKEIKLAAVKDYLSGQYSKNELLIKYGISTDSLLTKWINLYTSHRELKDSGKGSLISMTKGRRTTFEERLAIVKECLDAGKDYRKTAEKHQVSYQQVYSWVKKFLAEGAEALQDKRGSNRDEKLLSPEEKKAKELELENERLRAELAFLKKLKEYEGRRF